MFQFLPRPTDNAIAARHIGFVDADLDVLNAEAVTKPIPLIGGALPIPPVLRCYANGAGTVGELKRTTKRQFDNVIASLVDANMELVRVRGDQRFTDRGRLDATRKVFNEWFEDVSSIVAGVDRDFGLMLRELDAAASPGRLSETDAAGAIQDAELRGIVRAWPDGGRGSRLLAVALDRARSPMVIAALRGAPEASGISADDQRRLGLAYAVATEAAMVREVWSGVGMLDALHFVAYWGTDRLAASAGEEHGAAALSVSSAITRSEPRATLAQWLQLIVSDASGVRVLNEDGDSLTRRLVREGAGSVGVN